MKTTKTDPLVTQLNEATIALITRYAQNHVISALNDGTEVDIEEAVAMAERDTANALRMVADRLEEIKHD